MWLSLRHRRLQPRAGKVKGTAEEPWVEFDRTLVRAQTAAPDLASSNRLMRRIQRARDAAQSLGIPADVSEAVVRRSFRVPHERPTDLAHKFHANDRQRTLSAADVRRILDAADESSAEEESEEEEEE